MSLRLSSGDPLRFDGGALLLGHFSDFRPLRGHLGRLDWILNASISRLWKERKDLFDFGRMLLLSTGGKIPVQRVLLVGLGSRARFHREGRREAYRLGLEAAAGIRSASLAMEELPLLERTRDEEVVEDFREAAGRVSRRPPELVLYLADPALANRLGSTLPPVRQATAGEARL